MPASQGYELYDVVTKQIIHIKHGEVGQACATLDTSRELLSRLKRGVLICLNSRYILPSNKSHIFVLVDYETKEEFDCITNATLCYYLKTPLSKQIVHDISKLRHPTARCNYVQIVGRLFSLKGTIAHPRISKDIHNYQKHFAERQRRELKHKIRQRIAGRLASAIREQKTDKSANTEQLLGCSFADFLAHMEKQFHPNMNWNNYGKGPDKWQIDHIKPCARFDLLNPDEQKRCFHYSNLQPLWEPENLVKSDKYPGP